MCILRLFAVAALALGAMAASPKIGVVPGLHADVVRAVLPEAKPEGIALTIPAGTIFGIIGRPVVGALSLLRTIDRPEEPTSGRVIADGERSAASTQRASSPFADASA